MRKFISIVAGFVFISVAAPACSWWDEGHMQIAYLAYKHLDADVKEKADVLLKLNKDYPKWTAGAPRTKKRPSSGLSSMRRPGPTTSRPRTTGIPVML